MKDYYSWGLVLADEYGLNDEYDEWYDVWTISGVPDKNCCDQALIELEILDEEDLKEIDNG